MWANNVTGVIQPGRRDGRRCGSSGGCRCTSTRSRPQRRPVLASPTRGSSRWRCRRTSLGGPKGVGALIARDPAAPTADLGRRSGGGPPLGHRERRRRRRIRSRARPRTGRCPRRRALRDRLEVRLPVGAMPVVSRRSSGCRGHVLLLAACVPTWSCWRWTGRLHGVGRIGLFDRRSRAESRAGRPGHVGGGAARRHPGDHRRAHHHGRDRRLCRRPLSTLPPSPPEAGPRDCFAPHTGALGE